MALGLLTAFPPELLADDDSVAGAREVAESLPAAEYVEIEDVGHAAPFSHPHRVWPPAIEFLDRFFPPATH